MGGTPNRPTRRAAAKKPTQGKVANPARVVAAAVAAASLETAQQTRLETLELTNGIVLRFRPVAPLFMREAARGVPKPEVPKVEITREGREPRFEENPDDPTYQQAMLDWYAESEEAGLIAGLIMGTTVESVPEGWDLPEADGWIEQLRFASEATGRPIELHPEPLARRYLDWLRYYAIPSEEDLFRVTRVITSATGISEAELVEAVNSFRGRARLTADLRDTLIALSPQRNLDTARDDGLPERVRGA